MSDKGTFLPVLANLMLTITIASVICVIYDRYFEKEPKFVIVDMIRLVEPITDNSKLSEAEKKTEGKKLGERLREEFLHLSNEGYIVIDANTVIKAPESLFFTTE